jgi:DNA-binding XRE family transcriptional regulator
MNRKRGYKLELQISREEMKEYGEFFKSIRLSLGFNLEQMAKEIGVFRTTISLWEKAKTIPNIDIDEIEDRYREVVKKYRKVG